MKLPYIRAVLPIVFGHLVLNKCMPPETTAEPVSNTVRELMWPILLIFMGIGWELTAAGALAVDIDIGYVVLLSTLCLWFWLWCQKNDVDKASLVLILVAVAASVTIYFSAKYSPRASLFLIPLLAWVIFAERLRLPRFKMTLPHIQLPRINLSGPAVIQGPKVEVV